MRVVITATVLVFALVGCGSAEPSRPPTTSAAPRVPSPSDARASNPPRTESASPAASSTFELKEYAVPAGTGPHDVAPAADGIGVWYTGQRNGMLGYLDPGSGTTREISLGSGSAPHGVIVGPDGAPYVTDQGQNAIVRVDPETDGVHLFRLPSDRPNVSVHTPTFDPDGVLWFTGQAGFFGRLTPSTGDIEVFEAPGGSGPYGIDATPGGDVWYASLAGNYIARIDRQSGQATVIRPPTDGQGARRIWSDSRGRLWVSEWNAGQVALYDPQTDSGHEWRLPGSGPQAYAVFVDDHDMVWLTDFGANAIVRFDPSTERFTSFELPTTNASVRQLNGRPGEVWGAESAADKLVVIRSR